MNNVTVLSTAKTRALETEKVTVNLGFVDLGHIDLLVAEGFYGNRTDFIRTAIRNQLVTQQEAVRQVVSRKSLVLGLQRFSRADLESAKRWTCASWGSLRSTTMCRPSWPVPPLPRSRCWALSTPALK